MSVIYLQEPVAVRKLTASILAVDFARSFLGTTFVTGHGILNKGVKMSKFMFCFSTGPEDISRSRTS